MQIQLQGGIVIAEHEQQNYYYSFVELLLINYIIIIEREKKQEESSSFWIQIVHPMFPCSILYKLGHWVNQCGCSWLLLSNHNKEFYNSRFSSDSQHDFHWIQRCDTYHRTMPSFTTSKISSDSGSMGTTPLIFNWESSFNSELMCSTIPIFSSREQEWMVPSVFSVFTT